MVMIDHYEEKTSNNPAWNMVMIDHFEEKPVIIQHELW